MPATRRRRRWPWIVGAVIVVLLVPVAILVVPILTHQNAGLSNQESTGEQWPLSVTAEGDDGRTRVLSVHPVEPGGEVDTSTLEVGERLVVSGTGYDATQGIYVAICVIPDDPATKPGPCIGGVPEQESTQSTVGAVEFAPSNWINDDWAWKLFGARSYDDITTGTFTAYIEVGDPVGEGFDCREQACGIYTRNDHTALGDRVQDVYIPVGF
ncbi:hypothetical protein PYV02_00520 [Leifsonia sp. H3M29-4]|uniref:hypothetical protein n=1 Tax=Salinibacterium metalliresistens TaxID=3031321 RepID=UPI0023D9D264|nr:hypothetical protein [Salinibacterium metalliresistens]MDF1477561.1 hypothetical protein [Salinibacterium metalliresistens]